MAASTFQTNPINLLKLLEDCGEGILKLPDFQRPWVWDEGRIKSLIASISRAFPIGALMTLDTGGPVKFQERCIEGAPEKADQVKARSLILDGQQRLTSLFQVTLRGEPVETVSSRNKNKKVKRWFYIDIRKALNLTVDREDAIIGVPEDRVIRTDFGREVILDLSTPQHEYARLMFPVSLVFDPVDWLLGFTEHWAGNEHDGIRKEFRLFRSDVLENFRMYQVPVIALDQNTSREAVCVVFEKVNTGGKALDTFELVTATYAADKYLLRVDWHGGNDQEGNIDDGRHRRLSEACRLAGQASGILSGVSGTDFLQAISLFYTRDLRRTAEKTGKQGNDLPAVTGNRQALLNLPLDAYRKYQKQVEDGFSQAAKFLHLLRIYRIFDLPYQSQIVPLAAILADIGEAWEHAANREMLVKWYWNGVFGELYGSAVETRIARDFIEVPAWLNGGPPPSTISETIFRADRLKTMRTRLSAAYKGMNALLMEEGAQDLRSGQQFDQTVFFGENVDIHHIFPQDWCKKHGIKLSIYDSIINKTPLFFKTNRFIGGLAPSEYLLRLETGNKTTPPIEPSKLDAHLRSHLIDPNLLRSDNFEAFMADRHKRLLGLIEKATGSAPYTGGFQEEGVDSEPDEELFETEFTAATATA